MKSRRLISLAGAATLALTLMAPVPGAQAAPPAGPGPITDHGTIPLTATTVAGADAANMPDGSPRVWAAVSGAPAYLAEIDPVTGAMLNSYPMPGAGGSWGVDVDDDGTVWVSPYGNGHMYYLPYGADEIVDAGQPNPTTSFLWQVATDDDGVAYLGSFEGFGVPLPGGHVYSYDKTTQQWRDYGTFGDQYTYVRSTAVVGDKIYAGTGTTAAFFEIDIESGEKREIPLPTELGTCQFTYEMDNSGTDLYIRFDCNKKALGMVYDTVTGEWTEGPWEGYNMQRVGTDAEGNTYYGIANRLWKRTPDGVETNLNVSMLPKGVAVIEIDGQEHVVGVNANLMNRYNLATGELTQISTMLYGTQVAVRSQELGPDGDLHFGGYFSGGFASYSPDTDDWSFDPRLGQAESLVTVGDDFYAGVYPGAKIYKVDPTRQLTAGNPQLLFDLTPEGQDRPFGMADAGGLLAIGTVGGYGMNEGQLTIYDPASGDIDKYYNLIEDQGIVTLDHADGVLYGGTSVFGGSAAVPTQENARVFAFDMETRSVLWSREVEGAQIASAVAHTAAGDQLWVSTIGTLYALDAATGEELFRQELVPYDWSKFQGGTWQFDSLEESDQEGFLYGTVGGKIIKVNPLTRELTAIQGASGARLVLDGTRSYWVNGYRLYSAEWPAQQLPSLEATEQGCYSFGFKTNGEVPEGAELFIEWQRDGQAQYTTVAPTEWWSGRQVGYSDARATLRLGDRVIATSETVNPAESCPTINAYGITDRAFGFKVTGDAPAGSKLRITWTRGGQAQYTTVNTLNWWSGNGQRGWSGARAELLDANGQVIARSATIQPPA